MKRVGKQVKQTYSFFCKVSFRKKKSDVVTKNILFGDLKIILICLMLRITIQILIDFIVND